MFEGGSSPKTLAKEGWMDGGGWGVREGVRGAGQMCDQVLCPYLQHWHDFSSEGCRNYRYKTTASL